MKIRLEILNLITGATLEASGLLNLFGGRFETAMGWIIFGAMYLVMDDYSQKSNGGISTSVARAMSKTRAVFGWVGLTGSMLLFLYYLSRPFL